MKTFKFLKGYTDELISQNEYNRRRDMMANELYQNRYYEQMRRLDELLEEQRLISQSKFKLKINPPFWMKIKMFFQKIYLSLIYGS